MMGGGNRWNNRRIKGTSYLVNPGEGATTATATKGATDRADEWLIMGNVRQNEKF